MLCSVHVLFTTTNLDIIIFCHRLHAQLETSLLPAKSTMQLHSICCLLTVIFLDLTSQSSSTESAPKDTQVEIESNLMSLFGFRKKPNIDKSKVVIPQAMLDLYKKQTSQYSDTASIPKPGLHTESANTVRSFTHVESSIDAKFPGHHRFRLKFDVKSVPKTERVKAAELVLSRNIISDLEDENSSNAKEYYQQIIVNDIIRPGIRGKYEAITRLIDSKRIDTRKNSTLSLDVLPAVERWLEKPSSNHGLIVYIYGFGKNKANPVRHIRLRRDANENEEAWNSLQPLLYTYTDDGKNKQSTGEELAMKRSRRSAMKKRRRNNHHEPCKRHPMYVDFTDVGWHNWIVAPPGYDAFYCHGECNFPFAEHLNTTNHAIVQALVNSVNPSKVPKACCVPTNLSSISMLYLDDDNKVVLKNYKEMAVVGCGCR